MLEYKHFPVYCQEYQCVIARPDISGLYRLHTFTNQVNAPFIFPHILPPQNHTQVIRYFNPRMIKVLIKICVAKVAHFTSPSQFFVYKLPEQAEILRSQP
jgi:hypothetical protein